MNKIISILICCFIAGCLFVSCEQPDIPDVPNYDKTEILTFKVIIRIKKKSVLLLFFRMKESLPLR